MGQVTGDIENLNSHHEYVEDVAVVVIPDEVLSERICVYIKPAKGATITYFRTLGASVLQLPKIIELIDSIPLTKITKTDASALREDIKKRMIKD